MKPLSHFSRSIQHSTHSTFKHFHSTSDSAFTERIMGLPVENYKGYVEADATQQAKNIESDTLFLIHGMADASAPYHHSVQLARSLTDAGTIFRYTVRSSKHFRSDEVMRENLNVFFSPTPTRVMI